MFDKLLLPFRFPGVFGAEPLPQIKPARYSTRADIPTRDIPNRDGGQSRPRFYYATGTAFLFDIFGSGYGQIGGGQTILVPGIDGRTFTFDGAPVNDPFPFMLDAKLWDAIKVDYPAAALPMITSLAQGKQVVIDLINSKPGPFAVGGYSQGAALMSSIIDEIRYGSLQSRQADLLTCVTFGNPCRETNHTWPGSLWSGCIDIPGSTTGGHGCFPESLRLKNTPNIMWDFVNQDEIIAGVGDSLGGQDIVNAAAFITQYATSTDVLQWLATTLLTPNIGSVKSFIDTLNYISSHVLSNGGGGHVLYPTQPPPGDPMHGLTSYQIALQHLQQVGESCQSGGSWDAAPFPVKQPKTGQWSVDPPPRPVPLADGWYSLEVARAPQFTCQGNFSGSIKQIARTSVSLSGQGLITSDDKARNIVAYINNGAFSNQDTSQFGYLYSGLSAWTYSTNPYFVFYSGEGTYDAAINDGLQAIDYQFSANQATEAGEGTFASLAYQLYSVAARLTSSGELDASDWDSSLDGLHAIDSPLLGDAQTSVGTLAFLLLQIYQKTVSLSGSGVLSATSSPLINEVQSGVGALAAVLSQIYNSVVSLSGLGVLGATGAPLLQDSQSSTGTVAFVVSQLFSRATSFAGSGLFSASTSPIVAVAGSASGSGALSAFASAAQFPYVLPLMLGSGISSYSSLSGSGLLSAFAVPSAAVAGAASGSGSLSALVTPIVNDAQSGIGTISIALSQIYSNAMSLSGSGSLSSINVPLLQGIQTGVGALTASLSQIYSSAVAFAGSGLLSVSTVPSMAVAGAVSGSGALSATAKQAVQYKGSNGAFGTSVTIPSHNVGDIIVIFAVGVSTPTVPSAAGTVPTWSVIQSNSYQKLYYAVATATNHTSGTWTNAGEMIVAVLSGQGASPIGGSAATQPTAQAASCTAPAITMSDTSGASQVLHFMDIYVVAGAAPSFNAAPAGYTARVSAISVANWGYRLLTKDLTTSDGAVANTLTASNGYPGAVSVEIKR
jgi:hypothetical protein